MPFNASFVNVARAEELGCPVINGDEGRADLSRIQRMRGGVSLDYDNQGWLNIVIPYRQRHADATAAGRRSVWITITAIARLIRFGRASDARDYSGFELPPDLR